VKSVLSGRVASMVVHPTASPVPGREPSVETRVSGSLQSSLQTREMAGATRGALTHVEPSPGLEPIMRSESRRPCDVIFQVEPTSGVDSSVSRRTAGVSPDAMCQAGTPYSGREPHTSSVPLFATGESQGAPVIEVTQALPVNQTRVTTSDAPAPIRQSIPSPSEVESPAMRNMREQIAEVAAMVRDLKVTSQKADDEKPPVSHNPSPAMPTAGHAQSSPSIPLFVEDETDAPIPGIYPVAPSVVPMGGCATVQHVTCAPVSVAPTHASPSMAPGIGNVLMGPVGVTLAQIVHQLELFNDQPEKWIAFKAGWQNFLREVGAGQPRLPDEIKLAYLRHYGGPTTRNEIQRRLDVGEPVSYNTIWCWLCSRFDPDVHTQAREEWRALRPEYKGKLDLAAWRHYQSTFKLLWGRIRHKSDTEAYDAVMRHLPATFRESVTLEEEKRDASTPAVRISNYGSLTRDQICALVQHYTGQQPFSYRLLSTGEILLQLTSKQAVETLLSHQGQRLTTGDILRLEPDKQKMTWEEIFEWIDRRLRGQAASDHYGKEYNQWRSALGSDTSSRPKEDRNNWSGSRGRSPERGSRDRRRTNSVQLDDLDRESDKATVAQTKARSKSSPSRLKGSDSSKSKGKSRSKSAGKSAEAATPDSKGGASNSNASPVAQEPKSQDKSKGSSDWRHTDSKGKPANSRGRGKSSNQGCWYCESQDHWHKECPYAREGAGPQGGSPQ
jgi:hypothetical protein